jgi:hypothetical protein
LFASLENLNEALRSSGYIADSIASTTVYLAAKLNKPLLLEGPADPFEADGHLDFSREVWVIEAVCIPNELMWHQFHVASAERVALAIGEVRERHPMSAANGRFHIMNLAGEAVRGQPFRCGGGV